MACKDPSAPSRFAQTSVGNSSPLAPLQSRGGRLLQVSAAAGTLAEGLWQEGVLSQLPSTGKQHMWMSSSPRDSFWRPRGWGQVQVQGKELTVWNTGPCPKGQDRPVELLLLPHSLPRPSARCPGPSWVGALVWRWTAQLMCLWASQTSAASPPDSCPSPAEPALTGAAVSSVCTGDDTVSRRSSFILVRSATLSGFCLNFSSNKKLTPPQSSHNPRAERLKKSSRAKPPQRQPFTGQVSALTPPPPSLPSTGSQCSHCLIPWSADASSFLLNGLDCPQLAIVSRCHLARGEERVLWPITYFFMLAFIQQIFAE